MSLLNYYYYVHIADIRLWCLKSLFYLHITLLLAEHSHTRPLSSDAILKLDTKTWNLGEKTMLDYTCTAISYCNDGLVYASNSTFVHKFNLTGLDSDICRSLNSYCIKAHDTDHIVVGNYGNYTVKCMSSNGSEKFVYRSSNLKHPFGLDVDRQGNAYIVGLTSRNLHQVSFDGKRSRILLQDAVGGQDTCCVKFKPLSQEFLVTADGGKMLKFYKMDRA